jgi:hypothetical protein
MTPNTNCATSCGQVKTQHEHYSIDKKDKLNTAEFLYLLGCRRQRVDGKVSDDLALHLGPRAVGPLVVAVDGGGLGPRARPTRIQGPLRRS